MNKDEKPPSQKTTAEIPVIPLARHLPPCLPGRLHPWLQENAAAGSWVLDPFCSSPETAIQAARAGYKALVTCNNPLLAFEMEMLCQAHPQSEYLAALAELASSRQGDSHLESLLQSYYLTTCVSCGREIQADAFLWKRGEPAPYARFYHCPYCGDEGLHPTVESDARRLIPLSRSEPLHHARAFEKATLPEMGADERRNVEEALKVYPVRALVVIVTLLNKLDAYPQASLTRRLLEALLLPVLDAGTLLWPYPQDVDSPHSLQPPAEYLEKNLWRELESAVDLWTKVAAPLELTHWPAMPQGSGICLFPGRAREFAKTEGLEFAASICCLPRPNQAFWTLSALWSAWLWGRESSARYSGVLSRRRFDWHWHARALHSPLDAVSRMTQPGTPVLGLVSEAVPGFVLSAIAAASSAGLETRKINVQSDHMEVQFSWQTSSEKNPAGRGNAQEVMRVAIRKTFMEVGQPLNYLAPYTAAVNALAEQHLLPNVNTPLFSDELGEIQSSLVRIFLDHTFLHHYESVAQEIETGQWFLENPENCAEPLDDRVEKAIVNLLLRQPGVSFSQVKEELARTIGGLLVPADELVQRCLQSYADPLPESGLWQMKAADSPQKRKTEIQQMRGLLIKIADRLGLAAEGEAPLQWKSPSSGEVLYRFYLGASAIPGEAINGPAEKDVNSVYVLPGSRAALLQYKLDHNPRLLAMSRQGWHFLKFRYLAALAQRAELDLKLWQLLLDGDPLSPEKDTQLSIFL